MYSEEFKKVVKRWEITANVTAEINLGFKYTDFQVILPNKDK